MGDVIKTMKLLKRVFTDLSLEPVKVKSLRVKFFAACIVSAICSGIWYPCLLAYGLVHWINEEDNNIQIIRKI
jgi:hypothetical protein